MSFLNAKHLPLLLFMFLLVVSQPLPNAHAVKRQAEEDSLSNQSGIKRNRIENVSHAGHSETSVLTHPLPAPEVQNDLMKYSNKVTEVKSLDGLMNDIHHLIFKFMKTPFPFGCVNKNLQDLSRKMTLFSRVLQVPIRTQLASYVSKNGKGELRSLDASSLSVTDDDLLWIASRFPHLTSLDLGHNTQVTDEGLKHLALLKDLEILNLESTAVKSEGFNSIATLQKLAELNLNLTKLTDSGLENLIPLTGLTQLKVSGTNITDKGLGHLITHQKLTELDLSMLSGLTSQGLRHLASLKSLKSLGLGSTHTTNEGVQHLSSLTDLTKLDLRMNPLTDVGLEHLSHLENLIDLSLAYSAGVTDAGVKSLIPLRKLKQLNLLGTSVTSRGRNKLPRNL